MQTVLMHKVKKRRDAVLLLACAWAVAYLHSYGHRLGDDLLLTIQMLPGALVFAGFLMPTNLFRVIMGAEPGPSLAWPLIIGYWAALIPLQVAYLWSKLSLVLMAILAVLLVSTHGCHQWANYDAW